MRTYFAIALLSLGWVACKEDEPVKIAAMAYENVLPLDEVASIIPDNSSAEDSIRLAQTYINSWLREQVVLHQAELNLQEDQKDFRRQMEDYRKSLLIYEYESKLIEQKLDTVIKDEAIEEYYLNNLDNFQLKDYIVQTRFCILDLETPKLRKFRKLFYSEEAEDLSELEDFCIENNARYFLQESKWMYFEDLLKEVPIEVFDRESFLKKNKTIEFERDNKLYFLIIKDYKFKDSVSPLSLEKERIRNILLNKRKNELLVKMRNDLFTNALRKKDIREVPIP